MTALGLYVLAAHAAGDFPLQPDWMATQKRDGHRVRLFHVAIYTLAFVPVTIIAPWTASQAGLFLMLVAGPHYVVDSRRWADPTDALPGRPLWFDQAYHLISLAVAVGIVQAVAGWSG